jgi:predicted nuclease of predicted toxin-antitoxin system
VTEFPAFYLNENIPVRIVPLLASKGIKAVHTLHVGNQGKSDESQLEYAASNNYVMLTHNRRHFRGLHNRWVREQKSHAGIVVIRCDEPENLVSRIEAFCNQMYSSLPVPFCVAPPFVVPDENDTEQ